MNIDDFVPGTAYVKISEHVFSDKEYFKQLLKFLRLPDNCTEIEIDVIPDTYRLTDCGIPQKVAERTYRGR